MSEPALRRLHPRAVTLFRIGSLGRGALVAGLVLAAEWILGPPAPFGVPTLIVSSLATVNVLVVPALRYRAWGFALRATDLYLCHGVLFRTTSIIPHARIQHVDTRHGPIDRLLGLAALAVYTAGTTGSITTIPALGREQAEKLRDHLAAVSGVGDAV